MTPQILTIVHDFASLGVTPGARAVFHALRHREGYGGSERTIGRLLARMVKSGELVQEARGVRLPVG